MAEPQLVSVLRRLRHLTGAEPGGELTDAQLLGRFVGAGEETAFAMLLERHGRLVWNVCRHVLRHEQDVEDAFQATFLVLARKAGSIRKAESLSSWLHGVAYRVALRARARAARQAPTPPAAPPLAAGPAAEAALREVQAILDDEVRLLPGKLRAPFVLCCLEGRSKAEAARELGWKEGTVSGRLAQARERLRGRLARRGVALAAALTATALAEGAAAAAVPAAALCACAAAVSGKAAGSAGAVELAEGVMQSLLAGKLRGAAVLLLLACLGIGWMALVVPAAPPGKPAPPPTPAAPAVAEEAKKDPPKPALPRAAPLPLRRDAQGDPLPPGALARLGTLRLRHSELVSAVVHGRDGKFVASAGYDGAVRLWDVADGKELACLRGHTGSAYCLALSPDGKTLASGGAEGLVCLWDVAAAGKPGTRPRQLRGDKGPILALEFAADGKVLFSGDKDSIRAWDVAAGNELRRFGEGKGWVRSLALSPDGKALASAHLTGTVGSYAAVHLWTVPAGTHVRELLGKQRAIYRLAFSPDGRTLATGGDDGARVWEVDSGTRLVKLRGSDSYAPCVHFFPSGRTLLVGGGGFLREWRLPTGQPGRSFAVGSAYTYAAAFSPDGKTLVTGGTRAVTLWDVATAKPRHQFVGHHGDVNMLVFTPDSKELLTGGHGRAIYRWQAVTGRQVGRLDGPRTDGNHILVLSPDGNTLATQGNDLAIHLLDARTGRQRVKFTKHLPPRTSAGTQMQVVFAPDGKTVYSSTMGVDHHIRRWEVATGNEVLAIPTGPGNSSALAISPDGKTLYSATLNGPVRVWEAASGKELRQMGKRGFGVTGLLVSPTGRHLAGVLVDRVCVWDTATGKEVCALPPPKGHVGRLAFSPDGRTLAVVGNEDERIRFWEVATEQLRLDLAGHAGSVKVIAFSPDGRLLATGSSDTTALVWDWRALPLLDQPPATELTRKSFAELSRELSSTNGAVAFRAVCVLARAPKQSVPWLAEQFGRVDAKKIARLVAQLDDEEFAVRSAAMKELEALGKAAQAALRKAQATHPSVDVRLRAGVVLRSLEETAASQRLRELRSLEVLELAGTPEARRLVEELARGPAEAELALEAKAALGRMKARASR